jgi:hypothetical protein
VINKVEENILKDKDLTLEIQRMWNVKNKSDINKKGQLKSYQNHSENT